MIASYMCVHKCVYAYMNHEIKCALLPMSPNKRLIGTIGELITGSKTLMECFKPYMYIQRKNGNCSKAGSIDPFSFFWGDQI